MITLTGIVYNFVMYKIFLDWGTTAYSLSRTITHVIAPAGLILDWVLFDKHNMMKIKDVFIWLLYPASYYLFSVYISFRYNISIYFFLSTSNGYMDVLRWTGILFGILLAVSIFYVGLDKLFGHIKNTRISQNIISSPGRKWLGAFLLVILSLHVYCTQQQGFVPDSVAEKGFMRWMR